MTIVHLGLYLQKIKHEKNKKQITYDSAILKIYDLPVMYFPKFFHPDPSVKRQSGLLQPKLNNSNILGNSFTLPYYNVISENKDSTIFVSLFDRGLQWFKMSIVKLVKIAL